MSSSAESMAVQWKWNRSNSFIQQKNITNSTWRREVEWVVDRVQRKGAQIPLGAMVKLRINLVLFRCKAQILSILLSWSASLHDKYSSVCSAWCGKLGHEAPQFISSAPRVEHHSLHLPLRNSACQLIHVTKILVTS